MEEPVGTPTMTSGLRVLNVEGLAIGVSSSSLTPAEAAEAERLAVTLAPGGPGIAWAAARPGDLDRIVSQIESTPVAAATLVDVLGLTAALPVAEGLVAESTAYSMLLASGEFAAWRARTPRRAITDLAEPVAITREDDVLSVTLNNPGRRNAFGHAMRDAMLEALAVAEADPALRVVVSGEGPTFSSGGDLDEFGTAPDPARAHLVRMAASPALAVHRLGERIRFQIHGACFGAGVELPGFAAHVRAHPDTTLTLPELSFGLIPGAGGTVSVTRRIGRWRTAYLALTGRAIDAEVALAWGLVDELG